MKKRAVGLLLAAGMVMTSLMYVPVSAEEAEVITLACWYDEDEMSGILEAINAKLEGKYVVEYTYISNSDWNNVISTQLAAGEGPDIVADGANFPARIKAGNVKDITGAAFLEGINEVGFSLCSDGGKIYGVPSYGWFGGMWYNEDILAECGVEVPKTFDEFVSACEVIKEAGYEPMGFGLADGDTAHSSLLGYLENSFYHNNDTNAEGIAFDNVFANGEITLAGNWDEAVTKWYTLIEKGFIHSEMLGMSNEEAVGNFIAGKSAFLQGGPWQYTNIITDGGVNAAFMPHLSESGENVYVLGGPAASFGVNANTKNEEGAMAVLEAIASVEVQQAIVDANTGGFSYKAGVVAQQPEEYAGIADILNNGNVACAWDRWSVNMPSQSLIDESIAQVQGLVSGDLTIEDYLAAMDEKANSIRYN